MACEVDPLRDASFELALRLKNNGVDAKIYLMKDYIHGFCSFDMKSFGIDEYHNGGTIKSMQILKELLQLWELIYLYD